MAEKFCTLQGPPCRAGDWRQIVAAPIFADMEDDSAHVPKRSLTETLFVAFLRIVAISCLWLGIQYWSMLVGYSLQGHARFDLLSLPWKVAASSLAVGFPVAALGLWMAVSWGPVIWVVTAGGQVLMHGVWPEIFGHNALIVPMHLLVAVVYMVFRAALWLEKRHKAQEIRVDLP